MVETRQKRWGARAKLRRAAVGGWRWAVRALATYLMYELGSRPRGATRSRSLGGLY